MYYKNAHKTEIQYSFYALFTNFTKVNSMLPWGQKRLFTWLPAAFRMIKSTILRYNLRFVKMRKIPTSFLRDCVHSERVIPFTAQSPGGGDLTRQNEFSFSYSYKAEK